VAENSRTYSGEKIDLGYYRIWFRAGRVHVETDHAKRPWLDKRGDTIYVVANEKLDIDAPEGLN
jgi:hypothetical protein